MFLRFLQCSNCGAKLEPPAQAASVRCAYCGATYRVPGQPRVEPSAAPVSSHPVAAYRWQWTYVVAMVAFVCVGPLVAVVNQRARVAAASSTQEVAVATSAPVVASDTPAAASAPPSSAPKPRPARTAPAHPVAYIDPICHVSGMDEQRTQEAHAAELALCAPEGATRASFVTVDTIVEPSGRVRAATPKYLSGAPAATDTLACVRRNVETWVYPKYDSPYAMRCTLTVRVPRR